MHLGHVFTLTNRSMMKKSLLAVVSVVLSSVVLLSSVPAFAQNTLKIVFIYKDTGKKFNNLPIAKISSFIFRDSTTNQEIKYKKLVIDGNTVIRSRVYSEPGMNGMDMVEFSFNGGKYTSFGAPMKGTISKNYELKNGTLTLLD